MRIITIKTKYIKTQHAFIPELYIEKMLFSSYLSALSARAMLSKHFGKMEIKHLKGGYGLYTRSKSYAVHNMRHHRKKVSRGTICRALHGGRTNSPIGIRFGSRGQH
jgi:hypothetical protein